MEKTNDYFKQRNIDYTIKLREIKKDLPPFCNEFFIGIEHNTSVLTRINYAYDLRIFFFFLTTQLPEFSGIDVENFTIKDLCRVTTTNIELYVDYLSYYTYGGKHYTNENNGKARKLSTVRAMFKYFFNKDYIPSNVAAKITMPKIHDKEIVRLETDEVVKLLNVAEFGSGMTGHQVAYHERTRIRDTALLTLFLGTGIRISECVGLNVTDIDFATNGFTITRKGGSRVILYFSDEVADALKAYIDERNADKRIPKDEPALFLSMQYKRISTRAVQNLVKKYSQIITPLKRFHLISLGAPTALHSTARPVISTL
jgi:Site-specific recombinase XerD